MKQVLFFLTVFTVTINLSLAQDRNIARGAEPGELYLTNLWYGIYNPIWGDPYYDTLRTAVYRLTENGKKLTIQYDVDYFIDYYTPPGSVMYPDCILADATPGVVYSVQYYIKNDYEHTALWVSFDYGKNWIFREENIGQKGYYAVNLEGVIYRYGYDGRYKSTDYGQNFYLTDEIVSSEPGLQSGEAYSVGTNGLYQGRLGHTYDFWQTYTQIPIDSQYVFGQIGVYPDVYRGGKAGEVYVSSEFPVMDNYVTYKVSFSADTGYTFRHVFVSESYANGTILTPSFMSDREPGVFYIVRRYQVDDYNPDGWHTKFCIEYYRDYGETLEAVFCHDVTKHYEYEEVICEHTTSLNAEVNHNSIQLTWLNAADNIRGYHVYRDNVRITQQLLTENTYLDENLPSGNYEYYIRTYYNEGCVSDSSNHVTERVELGTEELRIENGEWRIYPNPTTGELRIENGELRIENGELKMENVEIFDVYGRSILHSPFSILHSIDISGLQAGIYFVRITTEKGIITKKVVKN
jgi:hypothetical protein